MKFFRDWGPALAWAASISYFSTDLFSWQHTSHIIIPFLAWLFPKAKPETLIAVHFYIRKSAHFWEFLFLSVLVLRGIRAGRPGWHWSWALMALGVAAAYAGLDELHQAFVPSRTASIYDVMIDSSGAAGGQIFAAIRAWSAARAKPEDRTPLT